MRWISWTAAMVFVLAITSCGSGSSSGGGGGTTTTTIPATPTGLSASASAGTLQVNLSWSTSGGAASYNVKRSTTSGSGYTTVSSPATASYTDTAVASGTTYYYVVSAVNSAGESANSAQVTVTPLAGASTLVHVTVDTLTNKHFLSSQIYGGAYPKNAATVTDSGLSIVRWGGNATSTYNWQAKTYNADFDYFFEDFGASGFSTSGTDADSVQFVQDVKAAGSAALMTMPMLPWVAKSAEIASPANGHWSFSVAKYGAQCQTDQYNPDAGNGVVLSSTCSTSPTYITANPNDAYVPLLDDHTQTCPSTASSCVYRSDWATALSTAFSAAPVTPHYYDMDNEIDIWGSTHRDIHPNPSGYNELRDTFIAESRALKTWDVAAVRLGPVSCCWYFYFNGANSSDKANHAGVDFLPWWLNEVYWRDQIDGIQSLDMFDIHAYPDAPSESTLASEQALAARIYRDYWDPTYVSESSTINQPYVTDIQPNRTIPFRIPRMRAMVNTIYPGVPLAMTEWSAEIASASDFSTALGDADAYGIMGRERVSLASRWEAPDPANPNYQALKLYTNYDGQHHSFQYISVADTNDGDPNLFSSYAAVDGSGSTMTVMFINKDPQNTAQVQFALNGFTPSFVTTYTLSKSSPNTIAASSSKTWNSNISFAPYSITLLVIGGSSPRTPTVLWDLNPDTVMLPAGGTVTLSPKLVTQPGSLTLGTPAFDSGISLAVTSSSVTAGQNGAITVTAGNTPGFYHYSVPATDNSSVTSTQTGYIIVGNPAATFTKTGDAQSGAAGTLLPSALSVTLVPGSSGGTAHGGSVLFRTDGGTISNGTTSGTKVIAVTNSSGVASVTLTLPSSAATVHVTAEGQYGLGHPVATFTATAH